MKISIKTTAPRQSTVALLAVGVPEIDNKMPRSLSAIDKTVKGALARAFASKDFTGKQDETIVFYPATGPKRILLVGLGERTSVDAGGVRRATAKAARSALDLGATSMGISLIEEVHSQLDAEEFGKAAAEGAGQGGWTFEQLRSKRESQADLTTVQIFTTTKERTATERGRRVGAAIAAGQTFARNLQMRPGNHCTPSDLAAEAQDLGKRHGIKVSVKRRPQMQKVGQRLQLTVVPWSTVADELGAYRRLELEALGPIAMNPYWLLSLMVASMIDYLRLNTTR